MKHFEIFGYEMACISEVYLSTVSAIMRPHGIERSFTAFLHICHNNGKITQKDLSIALRRDKVSTMRMVDYLCEKELVVRRQDCKDRRCHLLEITKEGEFLLPKVKKAIKQTNELLFKGFTSDEIKQFRKNMDKLYVTIETLPEPEFIVEAFKRDKEQT